MASTSTFPRELVNAIIHELTDDRPALYACSLVSAAFREISQRRIFQEITISFDTTQDSVRAGLLSEILSNNSSFASFVQSLILHLGDPQLVLENLALLDKFPNVRKLKLTSRTGYVDWLSMPEEILDRLTSMLHQSSLKFLDLYRQNHFPIDFLLRFPNIVELSMTATLAERSHGFVDSPSTHSPHLQSFTAIIYGDDTISLRSVQATLNVFASSLTDVTLDNLGYEQGLPLDDVDLIISFRGIRNLRSLKLVMRIHGGTMLLVPLNHSLETLSGASHHIKLELQIRYLRLVGEPYREHWSALDRSLCNLLDTSVIGSLRMSLSTYKPDEAGLRALRNAMSGLDSRLHIKTISGSQEFL